MDFFSTSPEEIYPGAKIWAKPQYFFQENR